MVVDFNRGEEPQPSSLSDSHEVSFSDMINITEIKESIVVIYILFIRKIRMIQFMRRRKVCYVWIMHSTNFAYMFSLYILF